MDTQADILIAIFFLSFVAIVLFLLGVSIILKKPRMKPKKEHSLPSAHELTQGLNIKIEMNDSDALETEGTRSIGNFKPSKSVFQPITPQFILSDLPSEIVSSPGGAYGSERDKYQTDLGTLSCTCGGGKLRGQFPSGDPRRVCYHLMRHLCKRKLIQGVDYWAAAIVECGDDVPLESWELQLETAPPVLVTRGTNPEWLSILARSKRSGERIAEASGPVERHGWSLMDNRWSYGQGPPGAGEVRKLLIS